MAMAFGHIPCCEFMMMSEKGDKMEPNFGAAFTNEPLPEDGRAHPSHPTAAPPRAPRPTSDLLHPTSHPSPLRRYIALSDAPGFGLELNREQLHLVRPFDRGAAPAAADGQPAAKRGKK